MAQLLDVRRATHPNYEVPFRSNADAVRRLMVFHAIAPKEREARRTLDPEGVLCCRALRGLLSVLRAVEPSCDGGRASRRNEADL